MNIKEINENRSIIQETALLSIENNHGKGILTMATGTGKSKIPIDYIRKHKKKRIALIVPTEKLRDSNWKNEFIKWKAKVHWKNVDAYCYASAHKIKNKNYDLVILDECHNITPLSIQFFENNTCGDIIALTATLPKEDKMFLLSKVGLEVTYECSLDLAVGLGIVSPYNITVVYTDLNSVDKNVLSGNKQKTFYTSEYSSYEFHNKRVASFYGKNKTMAALSRMRFIYNLKSKTDAAQFLLDKVIPQSKKTLIFTGSINQAELLCSHSYHSKTNDKDLEAFIKGKINRLSCVEGLNEGINIPYVQYGLATQLNSNSKDIVQRLGRLIRLFEGHQAHLYILCCRNTVDENWVNSALSEFDQNNIEYVHISELKRDYEN